MRTFLSMMVIFAGAVCLSPVPAKATLQPVPELAAVKAFASTLSTDCRRVSRCSCGLHLDTWPSSVAP
jgi:hypothetical protein